MCCLAACCLLPLAACCLLPLAALGCPWLLLAVPGCPWAWLPLPVPGCPWLPLLLPGPPCLSLAAPGPGFSWLLLAALWLFLATPDLSLAAPGFSGKTSPGRMRSCRAQGSFEVLEMAFAERYPQRQAWCLKHRPSMDGSAKRHFEWSCRCVGLLDMK